MTENQIEKRLEPIREMLDKVRDRVAWITDDTAELIDDLQNYVDGRSEAWMEGERGQAYQTLLDELNRFADEANVPDEVPELDL